jgi:hypothetical protein
MITSTPEQTVLTPAQKEERWEQQQAEKHQEAVNHPNDPGMLQRMSENFRRAANECAPDRERFSDPDDRDA